MSRVEMLIAGWEVEAKTGGKLADWGNAMTVVVTDKRGNTRVVWEANEAEGVVTVE